MTAPVIRIGMTPEELAEQLVELRADLYAAGDRQTEMPLMLYVVRSGHLGTFQVNKDDLRGACESAAAIGADLLAVCAEGWAIVGKDWAAMLEEHHKVMNDLSLRPDRREVLTIHVASATGQWWIVSTIDRSGDKVRLGRLDFSADSGANSYSRFLSDLPWVAS
jgi:hypothetical protein